MRVARVRMIWAIGLLLAACFSTLWFSTMRGADNKGGDAEPPPPKPPELKVLNRYIGTWKTQSSSKVAEWTPKVTEVKGTSKYEWVIGERFVQSHGRSDSGTFEDSELFSFDPETKLFQNWYFDSMGLTGDSVGTWDEKKQTMTWKGDLGEGSTLVNTVKFVDKNTQEWTLVAKNKQGTKLLDMVGKMTRQK